MIFLLNIISLNRKNEKKSLQKIIGLWADRVILSRFGNGANNTKSKDTD